MIISNMREVVKWMKFEPGTYYKFVALVRAKDFNDTVKPILYAEKNKELFVRQWFIDSEEALEKNWGNIVCLCEALKARLYVSTDRKSVKKTLLKMQEQLFEFSKQLLYNPNTQLPLRKLSKFSASASQLAECSDGPKYWMIDIDGNGLEDKGAQVKGRVVWGLMLYFSHDIFHPKQVFTHQTPNGYHILVERDFDIKKYMDDFLAGKPLAFKLGKTSENLTVQLKPNREQEIREFLIQWKDNWSIKENALTLAYFNNGVEEKKVTL